MHLDNFFKRMLDDLYDGVYFVDRHRRILYWNAAAEALSGWSAADVVGSLCHDNILDHTDAEGCHLCQKQCPLVATIRTRQKLCKRVFLRHKSGDRVAVEVRVSPVADETGKVIGAVEVFRDAGPDMALELAYRTAREHAEKDPLTGLANRRALFTFLAQQQDVCRASGRRFSLILADLDHFKEVNDTCGHQAGDDVLTHAARILIENCREMDLAGRYGGDELAVVLPNTRLEQAEAIAERIRSAIESSLNGDGKRPAVTASIGAAESLPMERCEALLARADSALYRAKSAGRNTVKADPRPQ